MITKLLCVLCVLCGSSFGLDRNAFTFTSYNLELRVDPSGEAMTARGTITLRNDSSAPQANVTLQISSTLDWRLVEAGGKPLEYVSQNYTTDIDHTGVVREAIVKLPTPLPPHDTIELEVGYGGTVPADATRLTRIGVPVEQATLTDWDRISDGVTTLRGAGHVIWYPVSIEAASLSAGELFPALALWKSRESSAVLQANICWITDAETRLTVVANGELLGLGGASQEANTGCSQFRFTGLGQTVPTFAIGTFEVLARPAMTIYYEKEHEAAAQEYVLAAEKVLPWAEEWFGKARRKLQIIELNAPGAVPFDAGIALFTPLHVPDRNALELALVHQVVHVCFDSPREWIYEGLAHFGQALYRERQAGRAGAIAYMREFLPPLQATEKDATSPRGNPQPLTNAYDDVYFRTKAMYVWWMLRDMLGDVPLQRALTAYRADQDRVPSYVQKLAEAQASGRSLERFFDDWVYRDRGLPDFKVDSAFPRALLRGSYSVAVTVVDLDEAGAEVPVIVHAEGGEVPKRVEVRGRNKGFVRIEVPAAPTGVVVNDGSVPEMDYRNNTFLLARPK